MPLLKLVVEASGDPPDAVEYHLIEVPVAIRFDTLGLSALQNCCEVFPVGAAVLITFTVTV